MSFAGRVTTSIKQPLTTRPAPVVAPQERFTFFFGHHRDAPLAALSQWFERPFVVEGLQFRTAEHWMMFAKAELFDDKLAAEQILLSKTPREAKALGRNVRRFDEVVWQQQRVPIVTAGNQNKFGQNEDLGDILCATEGTLVEASPYDRIWGIGLGLDDPRRFDRTKWMGQGLLGPILMQVRAEELVKRTAARVTPSV